MSTDLCGEDVVVRLTSSPQNIISTESIVSVGAGGDAPGSIGRGAAAAGGGVELGRKLLLAARAGDADAVLELMAKGAPFTTDWLGTSPLHLAAANNHVEACAVLLRAGASRDARTKVERTPLHLAAAAGHAGAARLLLEHGAAADARDMLRMTPLHWAAARGHRDVARALLARGADPRLRCKFRKTPRCLAARANRPDLVALLDEHEHEHDTEQQQLDVRPKTQQLFKRVDIKPQTKVKIHADKKIVIESKTQPIPASANVGRGATAGGATATATSGTTAGGATATDAGAALLRAHGITLLPTDRGSTVLTALRSGRTVVLSDAGKLMLKESSATASEPHIITNHTNTTNTTNANILQVNTTTNLSASVNTSVNSEFSANSVDSGGVNIVQGFGKGARLKPAKFGKGVKLITLNKNQPLKRVIHPNDLQVKVVRVAAGGRGGGGGSGRGSGSGGGSGRGALKLLMDKAHLQRLLADTRAVTAPAPAAVQSQTSTPNYPVNEIIQDIDDSSTIDITMDESVELPGAQQTQGGSLRAQLTAAHAAIASLGAELRACRARLAQYEAGHGQ